MVSDGILPSNEGRGYVLRRLLRRAARHGRMLGIRRPFLVELVETVIQSSESAYPELREHEAYIKKVIGTEEANFARTIDAGMNILNNMIDGLEKAHQHLLKGLDVFKLNDTFGFPIDLTKEIAAEQGIDIDEDGFHAEMQKQKRACPRRAPQEEYLRLERGPVRRPHRRAHRLHRLRHPAQRRCRGCPERRGDPDRRHRYR